MKKVISLLASAALAFSACVSVFAAAPADADPKIVVHTPVEVEEGVYSLTVDLEGLGSLSSTTNAMGKISGTLLSLFDFHIEGSDLTFGTASGVLSSLEDDWLYSADSSKFEGILVTWMAGNVSRYYPATRNADAVTEAKNAATIVFAGTAGSTYKLSEGRIGYDVLSKGVPTETTAYLFPKFYNEEGTEISSITLPGGKPVEKELGLTIDGTNAKKENGYIWKLNLTQKNGAQANSFVADFTDSKGDTNQKKAKNNVADFFGGEGSVEFYVGLKTARTITEFKATVADSTAEGVTASDTWTAAE